MNQPALEIVPGQLTILTTSNCQARCAHCSVASGPHRADTLDCRQIIRIIDDTRAKGDLSQVIFAGGEPTILGEDLLDAIAYADCLGLGTRLVTNANWAESPDAAADMLRQLREAGLAELNVSADDFHLPFIPVGNVVHAWHAAKGMGFRSVVIALCSGPASKLNPDSLMELLGERVALAYNENGKANRLPEPAPDGTRYLIANNHIYRIGRGRRIKEALLSRPDNPEDVDVPCPWAIRSAAVSPKNHLVACCGIEAEHNEVLDFGSLDEHGTAELLQRGNSDPIVAAITALGPVHLQRRAKEFDPGLQLRADPSAMCEACEDLVTNRRAVAALREHPERLWADVRAADLLQRVGSSAAPSAPNRMEDSDASAS